MQPGPWRRDLSPRESLPEGPREAQRQRAHFVLQPQPQAHRAAMEDSGKGGYKVVCQVVISIPFSEPQFPHLDVTKQL